MQCSGLIKRFSWHFLLTFPPASYYLYSLSRPSSKSTSLKGRSPQLYPFDRFSSESNSTRSSYGEWVNSALFSDPLVAADVSSSPSTGSDGPINASWVTKGRRSVASGLSRTLVHLFTNPGRILVGNTRLYGQLV